jgi:probable O-glycosylation ligase (exosortase A-associated)
MGALVLAFIAVVGTHSRGALLGLVATGGLLWWRSERKLPSAAILGVGVCVALLAMPPAWFDRMESIGSALEDRSFQGRLLAWEFAVNVANDRLTGGGIKATEIPRFFQFYSPEAADFGKPLAAAHSIYFQVLGDHGYIGLVLYLTLLGAAALNLQWVRTRTRGVPELRWAFQLASALQVSLLAYLVTGAALSMAYTDLLMALLALTVAVKRVARRQLTASEPAVSPARLSRAKPASDVYVTSEMARKLGRPS